MGTFQQLLAELESLKWCPSSIAEVCQSAGNCDLLLLRGRHHVESFSVKPGMTLKRAACMIRSRKGNSRVRLYVTPRANNRL